ncbi:hypothetical protein D3C76_1243240 [compost metagenome]
MGICGQPPATVEGLAPGRHLDPLHQRLEAAQGSHGVQLVHVGIEAGQADIQHLAVHALRQAGRRNGPGPIARHHIRMGFVEDVGLWLGGAHRPQQLLVAANGRAAGQDGGIPIYLTHHQHQGTAIGGGREVRRGADIVFAHLVFAQQGEQLLTPVEL